MASSAKGGAEPPVLGSDGSDLIRVEASVSFEWVPDPGDSYAETDAWYDGWPSDEMVTASRTGPSHAAGTVTFAGVSSSAAFDASASQLSFTFTNGRAVDASRLDGAGDWGWDPSGGVLSVSAFGAWDNWIGVSLETSVADFETSHWSGWTSTVERGHWELAPDPHDLEVFAGAGDDTVYGGQGDQLLSGDDGNDALFAGRGADTLLGGAGNDVIRGGTGAQILDGGTGADTISGGTGAQTLLGAAGRDVLLAGAGRQTVLGGAGDDTIRGGGGAQMLMGGAGRDRVEAGRVEAGRGNQTLLGGAGGDVFALPGGIAGSIVVGDFSPAEDRIEVARSAGGLVLGTVLDLVPHISGDARGDAVLQLGEGAVVTLSHISAQRLAAHVQDWFTLA